jgi:integrase
MPARQRGFARKRGQWWLAGWYEDGKQRTRGGFETRTAALDYGNGKANEEVARANAIRFGDPVPAQALPIGTVEELVDAFLARHRVDEATLRKLRSQLRHATTAFGERRPETLQPIELDLWRSQLPALSAHYIFRAFRQVLEYAVAMGLLERNPTARIRNVRASVEVKRGQRPFESWEEVEAIAVELDPRFAAIPVVLVGTGLRPEELFALERRDLDLEAGVISVERVYSQRRLKDCKKSGRQRRRVPLRQRVVQALLTLPPRLDTPLLFPAARGGYIDGEKFRYREWTPALRALGIEHRRIYDCRHTYATWSLAAGVDLYDLCRYMGTSVQMIDQTYGHLRPRHAEHNRRLLDTYDLSEAASGRA